MTDSGDGGSGLEQAHAPQARDWIEVAGAGEGSPRRGEILEVLGAGQHVHFRVRWDEEHESLFYPGTDHFVVHRGRSSSARDAASE